MGVQRCLRRGRRRFSPRRWDEHADHARLSDIAFNGFLSGRNTSSLSIDGLQVTIDARYLSGSGVLLVVPLTTDDWIALQTVRLVPASFCQQSHALLRESVGESARR